MCRNATYPLLNLAAILISIGGLGAQPTPGRLDWQRIGNTSMELALPGVASGEVTRVWRSEDGATLYAGTGSGVVFYTKDFENWRLSDATPPRQPQPVESLGLPEPGARWKRASFSAGRIYAIGRFVYRSDDGGQVWSNLSGYRNQSILGEGLTDFSLSPRDPDDIVVSSRYGLWRSLDGGLTWSGLNEGLPNLPARRILTLPNGLQPARLLVPAEGTEYEIEWLPGDRGAWRLATDSTASSEQALRRQLSLIWNTAVTSAKESGNWIYAGTADGRLFASPDRGQNWRAFPVRDGGRVEAITVSLADPMIAVAGLAVRDSEIKGPQLLRTINGGQFWDDAGGNLPRTHVRGIAFDQASGSIYAATDEGVFSASTDLANLVPVSAWQRIAVNLPGKRALDVKLDEGGNRLFVLLEGHGVYAAMAPHRIRQPSIVNAADFSSRPAAPGSLLSILGTRADRVRAGELSIPVLANTDSETQIQVPFEAQGPALALTIESAGVRRSQEVSLARVSPAIFIDRAGAALLLDADGGMSLDAANPARSGARIQILTTGLGAVRPAWPTGIPAPMDSPPEVAVPVRVFVDREPVEVTRATLAPGYIGFYLIEIQLPKLVNAGPAELFVEAGARQSNRVLLYLMP